MGGAFEKCRSTLPEILRSVWDVSFCHRHFFGNGNHLRLNFSNFPLPKPEEIHFQFFAKFIVPWDPIKIDAYSTLSNRGTFKTMNYLPQILLQCDEVVEPLRWLLRQAVVASTSLSSSLDQLFNPAGEKAEGSRVAQSKHLFHASRQNMTVLPGLYNARSKVLKSNGGPLSGAMFFGDP